MILNVNLNTDHLKIDLYLIKYKDYIFVIQKFDKHCKIVLKTFKQFKRIYLYLALYLCQHFL